MFFEFSGISECYKPEHLTVFILFVFLPLSHCVYPCVLQLVLDPCKDPKPLSQPLVQWQRGET